MKITPNSLLRLGFDKLAKRQNVYTYKVLSGKLDPKTGSFHSEMFKVPLNTIGDLAYMLEIIDYYHR